MRHTLRRSDHIGSDSNFLKNTTQAENRISLKFFTYMCTSCHRWFLHCPDFLSFSLLFLLHDLSVCSFDLTHKFPALVSSAGVYSHTRQTTKPSWCWEFLPQPILPAHFTAQDVGSIRRTVFCRISFLRNTWENVEMFDQRIRKKNKNNPLMK